jgi:hypothetical protein
MARPGTLTLSTVPIGALSSHATAATPRGAAVSKHGVSPSKPTLTATPDMPMLAAVSAAPTVPECRTARPVLLPGLIPDATTSGGGPNPSSRATSTASAGGPSSPYAGTPGSPSSSSRWNVTPPVRWTGPMAALAPLLSLSGAATTRS